MAIGLILLFAVPKSMYGTNAGLVYAYVSYIFMNCIIYTANNLPYNALLSRMTLDVQDRATTEDVVDYGEWKTGVRSEGLVNSCTSFGMKVGIGLGSAVGSWILAFGGYISSTEAVTQPASAVASIRFGYGYFGAIIAAICLALIFAMNIDKNIKQIQSDLQAKRV